MYTTMTIPGIIPELEEIVYKEELEPITTTTAHSTAAAGLEGIRASSQQGIYQSNTERIFNTKIYIKN